jgi:ubiquinone/menaquinone biosynthesis C-methylase UbiE
MYLAPEDIAAAFAELYRVVKPGGYLVTAFKAGDGSLREPAAPPAWVSSSTSTGTRLRG